MTMNKLPETPLHRRMPAEWELPSAVLLAWPHADSDWADRLESAVASYTAIAETIARYTKVIIVVPKEDSALSTLRQGAGHDNITIVEIPTNDTWTRDYGPISLVCGDNSVKALNFGFNGWGLKYAANLDNQVTDRLHECGILPTPPENHLNFILEGGSIESDGNGTLLTTTRCLTSPNRNGSYTVEQITQYLCRELGVSKVLWLDHGAIEGDDTDGHIDTIARFAPGNVILYAGCSDTADEHYAELESMRSQLQTFTNADGQKFNLVELPQPKPIYDESTGRRLAATYANFLALNNVVFMPTYGDMMTDRLAAMTIESVFERPVVGIDARELIYQNGSLHCATMQIPLTLL